MSERNEHYGMQHYTLETHDSKI